MINLIQSAIPNRDQARIMIDFCHIKCCIHAAIINGVPKPVNDRRNTHIKKSNEISIRTWTSFNRSIEPPIGTFCLHFKTINGPSLTNENAKQLTLSFNDLSQDMRRRLRNRAIELLFPQKMISRITSLVNITASIIVLVTRH